MSNKIWRAMWKRNDIAFHQHHVNPLLAQFLPQLCLSRPSRILVPLCGKSLDMNLLADSGHHVIGIELSPIAVKDYFEARKVNPSRERVGCFTCWRHRNTEIWCGDIFDLTAKDISRSAVLYDCASLAAFPAEQRPDYVRHFYERLSGNCQIILVTTETANDAKPNSVSTVDCEVSSLYAPYYDVELLHGRNRVKQDPEQPNAPHRMMEEKIYIMKRR